MRVVLVRSAEIQLGFVPRIPEWEHRIRFMKLWGWLGCMIWAMMAVHITNDPEGSDGGESGLNIYANDPVRVQMEPPPLPRKSDLP